jgi:tRNA nucleotidyltransferase (CCA-adding enzyme)
MIGCYRQPEGHWLARAELRANGLQDAQICSMGTRDALLRDREPGIANSSSQDAKGAHIRYAVRRLRELEIHVSSATLFDHLWPSSHHHEDSLTRWMTPAQSGVIWRKLSEDCSLLMVSADFEMQQVRSSQIQLRHGPEVVQAFNFAA